MKLALTERFQSDVRALTSQERGAVFEALLGLPRSIGHSHAHAGLGIRKIHVSGVWEARAGLGIRVLFLLHEDTVAFVRAGTHTFRRYLKSF